MSSTSTPGRLVVGVDGSAQSDEAVDWAIDEAAARRAPLHLVYAHETAPNPTARIVGSAHVEQEQQSVLDAVHDRIAAKAAQLEVTSEVTSPPASAALVAASQDADLVVVGARGRGSVASILLGSTSRQVAANAACPVVVVRDVQVAGSPAPRVVVGYDGSGLSADAVAYAFSAAARRGLPVEIVKAWQAETLPTYFSDSVSDTVPPGVVSEEEQLVEQAIEPLRREHEDVSVQIHVTAEPPAEALIRRSEGAVLTVVGSRGLGAIRGLLLGSVSEAVLHRALSPVVVVRPTGSPNA